MQYSNVNTVILKSDVIRARKKQTDLGAFRQQMNSHQNNILRYSHLRKNKQNDIRLVEP